MLIEGINNNPTHDNTLLTHMTKTHFVHSGDRKLTTIYIYRAICPGIVEMAFLSYVKHKISITCKIIFVFNEEDFTVCILLIGLCPY